MNASGGFSYDDWTTTLERFVGERGFVDYEGVAADREVFDRFLTALETIGPETQPNLFPTREDRFAYYLNGYNASQAHS